ncbi:copper resistance CopC family protein [Dictyobacter arantiisoli]|uniref:CopC domain-containing protein n=1 Tax=Dictyobacter arantiisoli TaxID=2014874 RepID=A0A5A5TAC0_9CHLR|nr:copper resistance protein CopC [Dictyobacter arantiisoli]GCF08460.1 hypothetical protein KDI_20240 [Dictyobacter arantiisoli]
MALSQQRFRLLGAVIFSLGLFFALAGTSMAQSLHAIVHQSNPAINSVIAKAPTTITVTALENMKPGAANSNLQVYGPDGKLVNDGNAKVSLNNPMQMSVAIKPEKANGTYIVRWTTVSSDDGDPAQGAFVFTVGTSAAGASSTQTQPTATPKPASTSTTTTTSNGTPLWVTIATGVVALLVGAGAGFGARGARKTTTPVAEPTRTPVS